MKHDHPFFVVGSDRSGSTMLRLMLNEHPELHIPPESHFVSQLMDSLPLRASLSTRQLKLGCEIISRHPRWADFDLSNDELTSISSTLDTPTLASLVDSIYGALARKNGKRRWGDKTPDYVLEINRLRVMFPNSQFIHIIRDGRDVCSSLLRKQWHGTSPSGIGRYWARYVGAGIEVGRCLPEGSYLEVKYEQLVLQTEETLNQICQFLGVSFDVAMQQFHANAKQNVADWQLHHHEKTLRPPRTSDVDRWKKEATFIQILAFEAFAGKTMDLVGQERKFDGFAKILPLLFFSAENTLKRLLRRP